ncbi:hypothetical protein, partial [Staphylococcus aureus]
MSASLVGSEMCIRDSVFFQAEDGIRDRSVSRGLGDVYKRQHLNLSSRISFHNLSLIHISEPTRH